MTDLVVAAAQVRAVRGDLEANLATHLRFVEAAAIEGVRLLVFPELSLTGYEPDLAASLQLDQGDARLESLREAARHHRMHLVVGAPLASGEERPWLGALVLSPEGGTSYAKVHVHETELPWFRPGALPKVLVIDGLATALAICADTSHATHAADAARAGAELYAAGVMKTGAEYATHAANMQRHARTHAMAALTANYVGTSGGEVSAGGSAAWNERGELLARAPGGEEALVRLERRGGVWGGTITAVGLSA